MEEAGEVQTPEVELPDDAPEGLRVGLPWERVDPGMSPGGLMQTLRLLLFSPGAAFQMMRIQGVMSAPIVFLVLLGTIGTFMGFMWQSWARVMLGSMADTPFRDLALANSYGVMSFVVAPFFIMVMAAVATGVHHLCMLVFGGAPRPADVTLRVVCYAWGASYVWMFIPACGGLIAAVWGAVLTISGLREVHGIPGGRAAAAVIVPYVVAGCCLMLIWVLLATTMLASVA
ncbi:MAG: hypothetical protein GKS06_14375 [Acidobacteria bacterium]|nr:hypothetical protein [Acidobacteriota bacterium]